MEIKKIKLFNKNEPISAFIHFAGVLLSIVGLVLMIIFTVKYGRLIHMVGFIIFGISLIMLYSASTTYHILPITNKAKKILQRIDHAMIFVLIAGTYTPICLALPDRTWGWSLFGIVWGIAVVGIILKSSGIMMRGWISTLLYIVMGWLALIAIYPLMQWLTAGALFWLFFGGAFYTIGCIFYALDKRVHITRWFGMHEIFHIFVLAGSISHFWLLFRYVLYT